MFDSSGVKALFHLSEAPWISGDGASARMRGTTCKPMRCPITCFDSFGDSEASPALSIKVGVSDVLGADGMEPADSRSGGVSLACGMFSQLT